MKWYNDLYLGNINCQDVKKLKKNIKLNRHVPDIYIISFASNPMDLLEIIPSWQVCQNGYPKDQLQIIGLASGNTAALELVRQIVDDTYQSTGYTDVSKYLTGKWRNE